MALYGSEASVTQAGFRPKESSCWSAYPMVDLAVLTASLTNPSTLPTTFPVSRATSIAARFAPAATFLATLRARATLFLAFFRNRATAFFAPLRARAACLVFARATRRARLPRTFVLFRARRLAFDAAREALLADFLTRLKTPMSPSSARASDLLIDGYGDDKNTESPIPWQH